MNRSLTTLLQIAAVFALLFAAAAALQHDRNAWAGYVMHDETAHIVTGLMVHDYLANPDPANPVRFAEQFYLHYPKVAIGQWPPGFYALQAAWTLVFGVSRLTLQLLMAFLCAAIGTTVFTLLRPRTGVAVALISAALFVALPIVQLMTVSVMTEIPVALFSLFAMVCFAQYVETERVRWSLAFGAWAAFALLTKGSAVSLAFIPPLVLLLHGGKWHLLRRPGFWAPALLVITMCLPWYLFAMRVQDVRTTWAADFGIPYIALSAQYYFPRLLGIGGIAVTALALCGAWFPRVRREDRVLWSSLLALVCGVLIVHILIPTGIDYRHLTVLAAPITILFGFGVAWLESLRRGWGFTAAIVACLLFALVDFELVTKDVRGYDVAAQELAQDPELDGAVFLFVGDSTGESAFIAEFALRQRDFRHVLLRGSKVLGRETWSGENHVEFFQTTGELLEFLRAIPVAIIVRDEAVDARLHYPYLDLIDQLVTERADLFEQRQTYKTDVHGVVYLEGLHIYMLRDHASLPKAALDFDIATGLKRPGRDRDPP